MRFFYVESSDEHGGMTRADLDDVIAFAHSFPFLIEYDAILIKDTRLTIDNCSRFGEFSTGRPRAADQTKGWLAHD